ncbi:MAG TPA: ATP-binding cassette domain-containing protein [Chloroflexota bacterium]|jgi:branched-chain amino acid transport system ATP-binding protein|nr:ATP-binding cassette domain-containing protein [Chloroflexota bacterium]
MREPLLDARDLHAGYGRLVVVQGVSLQAQEGQVVAVLGANGAGKSTLLRALAGVLRLRSGAIRFAGKDVGSLAVERRVRAGIVLVPEGRELFPSLTVVENLRMGAYIHRPSRAGRATAYEEAFEYFPALRARRHARAAALSGGEGQMLALARALLARPRLLLLDEPSHGLAPLVVAQIFAGLERLVREQSLTVVLVEQRAAQALACAAYCYVLENGRLALEGQPAELRRDERIQRLYLGG